jgi:hypothetical protein
MLLARDVLPRNGEDAMVVRVAKVRKEGRGHVEVVRAAAGRADVADLGEVRLAVGWGVWVSKGRPLTGTQA